MLSKAKIKWINSLSLKKNRDEENVFVAEGIKLVLDLLPLMKCKFLAYTNETFPTLKAIKITTENELITENELQKITSLKSPQGIIAIFEKPSYNVDFSQIKNQLSIALDDIQDPGNLGTIIRLADWFGVKDVFCSLHSADIYNPKTIQATMGAIARVRVHYVNLTEFLRNISEEIPIYGTLMDGETIYEQNLSSNGIIVMGNEGNGISKEVLPFISQKLLIPTFPADANTSESLNVGIATAISVAEFRRRVK